MKDSLPSPSDDVAPNSRHTYPGAHWTPERATGRPSWPSVDDEQLRVTQPPSDSVEPVSSGTTILDLDHNEPCTNLPLHWASTPSRNSHVPLAPSPDVASTSSTVSADVDRNSAIPGPTSEDCRQQTIADVSLVSKREQENAGQDEAGLCHAHIARENKSSNYSTGGGQRRLRDDYDSTNYGRAEKTSASLIHAQEGQTLSSTPRIEGEVRLDTV